MTKQKLSFAILALLLISITLWVSSVTAGVTNVPDGEYVYQTYDNDPLKARIYTLDNGLTVCLTVYKEEPRIQTCIGVRTGSKKDPADATGLAHYLEHMLFKGTEDFGTQDYEKENIEIDKIIDLYEQRYVTTDSLEREKIYHRIDSISGVAAKHAIANEYDKIIASIGATGTNAFTSVEQTVYINNIPSNHIENWLTIEASRFGSPVMRIFHTELEVVYEEKNRALDNDGRKASEVMHAEMFKKHTYGTQTTLGSVEHLKNPSLQKVIDYYNTYYVPNNMVMSLSGDFDPSEVIKLIDKTFGKLQPKEVPKFIPAVEDPIEAPIGREVFGPSAENIRFAYRFNGIASSDADYLEIIDMILNNSVAGLIDLNLNQSQKVLSAGSYVDIMQDYSMHVFSGRPREGQTLEEVKDLLLSQIDLIRQGEFPDWLIEAVINDKKLSKIRGYESNWRRAYSMTDAYINELPWDYYFGDIERLEKITKQDIIDFANKHYGDNYVVVYKRTGEDRDIKKIAKPKITPVELNRDAQSEFARKIYESEVPPISPVFLDYDKDFEKFIIKSDIPVHYVQNQENELFTLYYILDMGNNHNNKLGLALDYIDYLGTLQYSPTEFKQKLYKAGCSFFVFSSNDQIYVGLNGLSENLEKGIALFEELLLDAQPNDEALSNMITDILKIRKDNKLSKRQILNGAMRNYGVYGPKSSFTNILSEDELKAVKPSELIDLAKKINGYKHRILYYGPMTKETLATHLDKYHNVPETLAEIPQPVIFEELPTTKNTVYVANYDMEQAEIIMLSKSELFNKNNGPIRSLFNSYFGQITFNTLRESKALAYSTRAYYTTPGKKNKSHYVSTYIGTQSDKLSEAMSGMLELLSEMPIDEALLASSKDMVAKRIQTERITKTGILFNYESATEMGYDHDMRQDAYEQIPNLTIDDVSKFHEKYFQGNNYTVLVLGDTTKLDEDILSQYGEVKYLTLDEIFGY